jgi:hypothetical protein
VAKGQSSRTSDARMPDVRHVENLTSASQEIAPQPAPPLDSSNPANRAAAELAALKAARAETTDYYAGFKQVEKVDKVTLAERRKQDRARLRTANAGGSWVKILLSIVALALTCGAVWYVLQMKPAHKPVQATSIEEMVKAGDYDGAKTAMEKKKAATKKGLTKDEQTKLNEIYLALAKQQMSDGDAEAAKATLSKLPKTRNFSKQAKKILETPPAAAKSKNTN